MKISTNTKEFHITLYNKYFKQKIDKLIKKYDLSFKLDKTLKTTKKLKDRIRDSAQAAGPGGGIFLKKEQPKQEEEEEKKENQEDKAKAPNSAPPAATPSPPAPPFAAESSDSTPSPLSRLPAIGAPCGEAVPGRVIP